MPFTEVAPDVWVARYEWFDVNVSLVRGSDGLLVVDTHASAVAAREVIEDVRALGAGEVVAVVNTHEHFDHTFGNGAFRAAYGAIPVHAHEVAAESTVAAGERIKALYGEPDNLATPTARRCRRPRSFRPTRRSPRPSHSTSATGWSSSCTRDAATPEATSWSGCPTRTCCSPVTWSRSRSCARACRASARTASRMDWPLTLDIVLGLLTSGSVVVPGHGSPVDRDFVETQRNEIGIVAETIRDLSTRGVPVAEALDAAEWPFPRDYLADAVRRGYEHLPRSQKRLPSSDPRRRVVGTARA